VRFAALRDRVFEGAVTEIAAAAEPATGTYAVEIGLPAAGDLAAGLVGTVELQPGGGAAASTVPIEAILEADGNEAAVFAVTPDGARVERRRVDVAFLSADRVVVARGLEGVEHVVTDGAAYLTDGDAVTVMP
jgi:multidrug efflux pump subunit AcrA (membrane-fusion protein)